MQIFPPVTELRSAQVFKVGGIYAATAIVALHVAATLRPKRERPVRVKAR